MTRSRDTRRRFEQWAKNTECEANTLSAVKGHKMAKIAKLEGVTDIREQSVFAARRGNWFEDNLLENEAKLLVAELREKKLLSDEPVHFEDFRSGEKKKYKNHDDSLAAVKKYLSKLGDTSATQMLLAGVTIRIPGGGMLPEAILVVDALVILKDNQGRFLAYIGEIKSYPDKEGYTDRGDLALSRAQAGIYLHGLRTFMDNECTITCNLRVSDKGFLVFSQPGSNFPSARIDEDLTYQAERAKRGFKQLQTVADSIVGLDDSNVEEKILTADTEYLPSCFSFCDRATVCLARSMKNKEPIILGEEVSKFVGEIPISRAIELMNGETPHDDLEKDLVARYSQASPEVIRRLRSYHEGKPLPRRQKKSIDLSKRTIILSFIRMGGEGVPWGIAVGEYGKEISYLSIPDSWQMSSLVEMLHQFESTLCALIGHPSVTKKEIAPQFQIIVPNSSHLEMLHNLGLRFMYAKSKLDPHADSVNRLGRIASFLFLESQRPGQQLIHSAAEILREHYSFPADDLRQGHLGFLLALLTSDKDLDQRYQAAKVREEKAIGMSLDPKIESDVLDPLLTALRKGDGTKEQMIIQKLNEELAERVATLSEAIDTFSKDIRVLNPGVQDLAQESQVQLQNYYNEEYKLMNGLQAYFSSPKTDYEAFSAAINYNYHIVSEELAIYHLLRYDEVLQREAVSSGEALSGKLITACNSEWVLECDGSHPLRLRAGTTLEQIGNSKSTAKILEVNDVGNKRLVKLSTAVQPQMTKDYVFIVSPTANVFFNSKKIIWLTNRRAS